MKIILAVDAIRHPLTGIGRYASELAKGLREHPQVDALRYFLSHRWVMAPHATDRSGTEASEIQTPVAQLRRRLAGNRIAQAGYRRLIGVLQRWRLRGLGDHVFHSPNYFLPAFDGPAIATIHDLSVLKYPQFHPPSRVAMMESLMPQTLKRATHLLTDSEAIRREVIDAFGWPPERITAIPLGVETAFQPRSPIQVRAALAAHGLDPGGYCLCVATIEPRKNIARLIAAHARLPQALSQRYPLVLAGAKGWNSDEIHGQIQAAQHRGTVRYLSYVREADLPLLFAGAYLFAFPSIYEGFGLPLIEAMASGIPLVTSTCPTLQELASDVGLLVDPMETDALAQALRRGLEDHQWRDRARTAGLQRASLYTWSNCIDRTAQQLGRSAVDSRDARPDKRNG